MDMGIVLCQNFTIEKKSCVQQVKVAIIKQQNYDQLFITPTFRPTI